MADTDRDDRHEGAGPPGRREVLEEEENLRRIVRRALKSLRLPVLRVLLRVVRYTEEGRTPMCVAAEDLIVAYKVEAMFIEAEELRQRRAREAGNA